ncbi:MAG: permease-like cell division protein FtsX [Nocardioidaceae bacterium]
MQLRFVVTELGSGLRRNLSMTIAVIVTIWISLALVALGLMIRDQVGQIEQYLGGQLEVPITFCTDSSSAPACVGGAATQAQQTAVLKVIQGSDYVDGYRFQPSNQGFKLFKESHTDSHGNLDTVAKSMKVSDWPNEYFVKMKSANDIPGFTAEVRHLPGVWQVLNLRQILDPLYSALNAMKWLALGGAALLVVAAVLQISNTIRLAAMARRREIGIMRLVGASSTYIQLPFVLEVVFSALIGAAFACATLAAAMQFIRPQLMGYIQSWPIVGWSSANAVMLVIVGIAVVLAIIPTLLMTRKYLKV